MFGGGGNHRQQLSPAQAEDRALCGAVLVLADGEGFHQELAALAADVAHHLERLRHRARNQEVGEAHARHQHRNLLPVQFRFRAARQASGALAGIQNLALDVDRQQRVGDKAQLWCRLR